MSRQIFRPSALKRYNERLEQIALPRYATLPWAFVLWVVFGLLLLFTVMLWAARTPVYASGPAVVVAAPAELIGAEADDPDRPMVAAFLPADYQGRLVPYQRARLLFSALEREPSAVENAGVMSSVAFVEPQVVAPAVVRSRLGLDDSTGLLVEGPVLVALIPLEEGTAALLGSIGEAHIEIGMQPGLALLPGVGRFFEANGSSNANQQRLELARPTSLLTPTEATQPADEQAEGGAMETRGADQATAVPDPPTPSPSPDPNPQPMPTTNGPPQSFDSFMPFLSDD